MSSTDAEFDGLLQVLIRALRRLGEAGHPDDASRLAATGWSAVRHSNPGAAERLNGTMHYLARLPDPVNTPHRADRVGNSTSGRSSSDRGPSESNPSTDSEGVRPCPHPTSSSTSGPSHQPAATS